MNLTKIKTYTREQYMSELYEHLYGECIHRHIVSTAELLSKETFQGDVSAAEVSWMIADILREHFDASVGQDRIILHGFVDDIGAQLTLENNLRDNIGARINAMMKDGKLEDLLKSRAESGVPAYPYTWERVVAVPDVIVVAGASAVTASVLDSRFSVRPLIEGFGRSFVEDIVDAMVRETVNTDISDVWGCATMPAGHRALERVYDALSVYLDRELSSLFPNGISLTGSEAVAAQRPHAARVFMEHRIREELREHSARIVVALTQIVRDLAASEVLPYAAVEQLMS